MADGWIQLDPKPRGRRRPGPKLRAAPQPDYEQGRVVAVFGPPRAGVSCMLRILQEVAETPVSVSYGCDAEAMVEEVEQRVMKGLGAASVLLLDGVPRNVEDVEWLWNTRLVHADRGAVIRIVASRDAVEGRLRAHRALPEGRVLDTFREAWRRFEDGLSPIEAAIRRYDLPYFCVPNTELDAAIAELARRSGVTR